MSWIGRDMPDDTYRNEPPDATEVTCPACEGGDEDCQLCYGSGWVSVATLDDMRDSGAEDYGTER